MAKIIAIGILCAAACAQQEITVKVADDGKVSIDGRNYFDPADGKTNKIDSFFKIWKSEAVSVSLSCTPAAPWNSVSIALMAAVINCEIREVKLSTEDPAESLVLPIPTSKGLQVDRHEVRVYLCSDAAGTIKGIGGHSGHMFCGVAACKDCHWNNVMSASKKDKSFGLTTLVRISYDGKLVDGEWKLSGKSIADLAQAAGGEVKKRITGAETAVILDCDGTVPYAHILQMLKNLPARPSIEFAGNPTYGGLAGSMPEDPSDIKRKALDLDKKVEDPIIKKDDGEHNETADDDDFKNLKGQSLDDDHRFGAGRGSKEELARQGGGGFGAIESVAEALKWLARHQKDDGSWSTTDFCKNCGQYGYKGDCTANEFKGNDQFDEGNTGLALLAFLGAGYTPASKEKLFPGHALTYGDVVKRGLDFLLKKQDESGRIGRAIDKYMYNHAICALALVEAFALTQSADYKSGAKKAIDFLVKAKNAGAGWRYTLQSGDTDSSVTTWAVMAFVAAEKAGLAFDKPVYADSMKWFSSVTGEVDANSIDMKPLSFTGKGNLIVTGYKNVSDAGHLVAMRGVNDHYYFWPTMTAQMMLTSVLIDRKATATVTRAVDTLLAFLPEKWNITDKNSWKVCDLYYMHFASNALFQLTGANDAKWKKWNDAMKAAITETQNMKGSEGQCKRGSWDPVERWSCEGGRVYTTAIAALTLEVYYRYPRVIEKK